MCPPPGVLSKSIPVFFFHQDAPLLIIGKADREPFSLQRFEIFAAPRFLAWNPFTAKGEEISAEYSMFECNYPFAKHAWRSPGPSLAGFPGDAKVHVCKEAKK
jgi:hypothetical protein